jgi:exonuclease SbcD
MITFIHTADIHFGVENYGKIDPVTGIHTRLLDFEKALNACIDYALEHQVDFFVFAGDAYKTANPSPTQQKLLMRCLMRLYKAAIPVVIVVGNHDHPLSFGKATSMDIFADLPVEGFTVVTKPSTISLVTKNGTINVVGIPWPTRNMVAMKEKSNDKTAGDITDYIAKAVGLIIKDLAERLDPHVPAILVGHLTVSNGLFSGSEKRAMYGSDPVLLPSQLAIAPFDYIALGHLHRYQNLNPHGYPALVYAGSIERVDFGERNDQKGFCHVTIEKKGTTSHRFIPSPMRPFVQVDIDLVDDKDQTEQILDALARHDLHNAIVKIVYQLPPGAKNMVHAPAIERACAQAHDLIGIIPLYHHVARERRLAVSVDMSFQTLLTAYFDTVGVTCDKKDALIEKTLALMHEQELVEVEGVYEENL